MSIDLPKRSHGFALRAAAISLTVWPFGALNAQVSGLPTDPYYSQQRGDRTSTTADRNAVAGEAAVNQSSAVDADASAYQPARIEAAPTRERERRPDADSEADTQAAKPSDGLYRKIAPPNEFEKFVSELVDKPIRRFGSNMLVPGARDFTAPPTTTVPQDYRINPGDEFLIGLTGSVEASSLEVKVDSDGKIFIPKVGSINVVGVRYGDLQPLLARQVSRQYRNFRLSVSVKRLHGITVYVTGFAQTPGAYTVSSLSTLVNAVLTAGGPSAGGSFRSIQVRRGGRLISDFDLYDLLLKGDTSADVLLQNNDVIYIAAAGAQIAVVGSVNVEAIYEARANETVETVLMYAGGVNTVADNTRLLILDPTKGGGWKEYKADQIASRSASRGEIIRVLSAVGIAQPLREQSALVTVSGEVARPGRYFVRPGAPMSEVIAQAGGLTSDAYVFGTVFTRESVRLTQRQSYDRAVRDLETLLSQAPLVSASQNYSITAERMNAVRSVVDQLEERKPDGRLVLSVSPSDRELNTGMTVENNDTIYVPPMSTTVGVFGSVPSPASFQYIRGERIGDYIRRAGGIQKMGDRSSVFVIRANGTLLGSRGGLFAGKSALGQYALPGDLIFVPIDATRGEFWARLRDISSALVPTVLAGAAIAK